MNDKQRLIILHTKYVPQTSINRYIQFPENVHKKMLVGASLKMRTSGFKIFLCIWFFGW